MPYSTLSVDKAIGLVRAMGLGVDPLRIVLVSRNESCYLQTNFLEHAAAITTSTPLVITCIDLDTTVGVVHYSGGTTNNRPVGTIATQSCSTRIFLVTESRTCTSDGTWSGSGLVCYGQYYSEHLMCMKLIIIVRRKMMYGCSNLCYSHQPH